MTPYLAEDIFKSAHTFEQAKRDMASQPCMAPDFMFFATNFTTLENLRKGVWEGPNKTYALRPPVVWETTNTTERTAYFSLNAFHPLVESLQCLLRQEIPQGPLNSDERLMLDLVLDWAQHGLYDAETFTRSRIVFRWYDLSVGCRVPVLLYFLQRIARQDDATSLDVFTVLAQQLHSHYLALIDEKFWIKHTNHGLFQSLGLYELGSKMPLHKNAEEAAHTGLERIRHYFEHGFSQDGFWLEHSFGYHHMMHETINRLCARESLPKSLTAFLKKKYALSFHALNWLVQPDYTFALVGDTQPSESLRTHPVSDIVQDGYYTSQPAGYAFYRKNIEHPEASTYFCFCASFHANVHKHLDDLSFIWWGKGIPLAIDSGMYMFNGAAPEKELNRIGFKYDDPMRMYVESNRAHNTVEIDEKPDLRQKANIYGSGILSSALEDENLFAVSGQVRRHSRFIHTRHMLVHTDGWVLIADILKKEQKSSSVHLFDQWFTLNPALQPVATQVPHAVAFETEKGILHLHSLTPSEPQIFCGQTQPFLAGWYCPQNNSLPTPALRLRQQGSEALMVTLLTFDSVMQTHVEKMPDGNLLVQWETPFQVQTHTIKTALS